MCYRHFPYWQVTLSLCVEELVDVGELAEAGVAAICEYGETLVSSQMMKQAMISCRKHGEPIICYCEDLWSFALVG